MNEVKEKAIRIAMGTFLSEWEGDAIEVYNNLQNDETQYMSDIDYVVAWSPFAEDMVEDLLYKVDCLINSIVESFS